MKGILLDIAKREKTRAPMETISCANVTFKAGIADDSRGKKRNNRQVTVLTKELWDEACNDVNTQLPWTTRRANLFVEGLNLENSTNKQLKIGAVVLEITGELEPCNRMDDQCQGLTAALQPNWRGGVTCKIIEEGVITKGDQVELT